MARKTLGYVNLEWICPRCGAKNPGTAEQCAACGGPQPDETTFQQSAGQPLITGEEAQKIAQSGADIICPYCSTRNPAGSTACAHCGAELKEGKQRESGEVLGAYQPEKAAAEIKCPHCGQMNPASALTCATCGGSLAAKVEAAPQAQAKTPARPGTGIIIAGIVGLIALIILCVALFKVLGKTESVNATVSAVAWQTSVMIEAFQPVTHQAWKGDIPAGAEMGDCQYRYSHTSQEPEPIATEICGTPYTVDQGNGYGEVVQDCAYDVYAEYCSYSVTEWTSVGEEKLQGNDLFPQLPNPALAQNQRLGSSNEVFEITFTSDQGSYSYTTRDASLFQQARVGSQWTLEIGAMNSIRSLQPVN